MSRGSILFHFAVTIADFYDVSLDYIAGQINDKKGVTKSSLSALETEVVSKLRRLDDIEKGRLFCTIDMLLNQSNQNAVKKSPVVCAHDNLSIVLIIHYFSGTLYRFTKSAVFLRK